VLGNHDQSRVATRIGAARARVAAMLLLTLRGTPTLYYGDELGLPDVHVPPSRVVDVAGRDPERSPMPWTTGGPAAGFTTGVPWLPMTDDPATFSLEAQARDPRSMLALHRRLLALRRAEPALHVGTWAAVDAPDGVLAYDRSAGGTTFRVLLNLRSAPARMVAAGPWSVVLATGLDRESGPLGDGAAELRADEGLVLRAG
jgi:alpha-glucosidase